ncbi:MAG TPA: HEAT repeat domain-containing protein [Planctomycetota bacterium]|nr:HEAT repeat domain-containing protein [Planctomycetota bacterium]
MKAATLTLLLCAAATSAQESRPESRPLPPAERAALTEAFFGAVRSGDDTAALRAASKLAEAGDAGVEALLDHAVGRDPTEIACALRWSADTGLPVAAKPAARFAVHDDAGVRASAIVCVAATAGPKEIALYVAATRDAAPEVRRRAYDALVEHALGAPETVAAGAEGMASDDSWLVMRGAALLQAAPAPPPGGVDPVMSALTAVAPRIRGGNAAAVLDVVGRRCGAAAAPVVVKLLAVEDLEAVIAALEAVARHGIAEAAPRVRALAEHDEPTVAAAAFRGLAAAPTPDATHFLVGRLEDAPTEELREAAAIALRRLTGKLFGRDVARWRRWLDDVAQG